SSAEPERKQGAQRGAAERSGMTRAVPASGTPRLEGAQRGAAERSGMTRAVPASGAQRSGTQRIQTAFERARAQNRAALIVFITCGDPDLQTTEALVPALIAAGADAVELG